MQALSVQTQFYLHGCSSLKEKRSTLAGLRDKFGKRSQIAVSETNYADDLRRAEWTFVLLASSAKVVEQIANEIETYVASGLDAELTEVQRRWLNIDF